MVETEDFHRNGNIVKSSRSRSRRREEDADEETT